MTTREERKQRAALLKHLREEHAATVAEVQERLKAQQAVRKQLRRALDGGPMTVPELAAAVHMPGDQVLWHITAMKKYDLIVEVGFDGEYYQYALAEETNP